MTKASRWGDAADGLVGFVRPTWVRSLALLAALGVLGVAGQAMAVDFAVDLPVQADGPGQEEDTGADVLFGEIPDVPEARLGAEEDEANLFEIIPSGANLPDGAGPNSIPYVNDVPERKGGPTAPGLADGGVPDLPPLPKGFQPRIYETDQFPVPQCLDANVRFWKQIYRDVETNEALIHDRDDLSRVFARVPIIESGRSRRSDMESKQAEVARRLQRLAAKMVRVERGENASKVLDAADLDLLASFRPKERRPDEIYAASGRLRVQSGLRQRFDGGIRRSLDLLPTITPIIEGAGVPRDIVHLPHVESSYVRTARSKVGAVGLWQIMPGTMRLLMGRSAVHRRTDPVVATRAAAKLLAQNYRSLRSWPLALTAYNHGLAGVSRGVRTTGSRDLCTIIERYQSRSFRFASSNFYAQFLAARHVALDKYRDLAVSTNHRGVLRPLLAHALREKSTGD